MVSFIVPSRLFFRTGFHIICFLQRSHNGYTFNVKLFNVILFLSSWTITCVIKWNEIVALFRVQYEYIFRVSHILPNHCRIKIQQNMTNVENIGHIVRWKRGATSYWLTCKMSTIWLVDESSVLAVSNSHYYV